MYVCEENEEILKPGQRIKKKIWTKFKTGWKNKKVWTNTHTYILLITKYAESSLVNNSIA